MLVHDTFLWGSRRFPLEVMPERERALADAVGATLGPGSGGPGDRPLQRRRLSARAPRLEVLHAARHELCRGRRLRGSRRAQLSSLARRCRRRPAVGCIGLSGGGSRAALLLRATSDDFAACAIAGMMSTYDGLLDHCVAPHTWMFFPAGWSRHGDWPDLASSGAPSPLLVQYLLDDAQFTVGGMRDADARMAAHYAAAGAPNGLCRRILPRPPSLRRADAGGRLRLATRGPGNTAEEISLRGHRFAFYERRL